MMRARLLSVVLVLQSITTLLALPVISAFSETDSNKPIIGAAIALLLAPGVVRRRGGVVATAVAEVLALIASFAVIDLLVLTIIFVALWVTALVIGTRIDRERALRV
jgi:hypothetical protein